MEILATEMSIGTGIRARGDGHGDTGTGKRARGDGHRETGTGRRAQGDGHGETSTGRWARGDGETGRRMLAYFNGAHFKNRGNFINNKIHRNHLPTKNQHL